MGARDVVPAVTPREAARAGITRWRLEGPAYTRVRHGLYVPVGVQSDGIDERIALAAGALPAGYAIGGWAAARLHEWAGRDPDDLVVFDGRLPEMDVPARRELPILVCGSRPQRLRPQPGVRLFRSDLAPDELTVIRGVPVTAAARTAFDLARLWATTPAVVALDRLRTLGLVDAEELGAIVAARPRWRGVADARRALALSDDHVESPRESMMRLLWLRSRLPRPICNAEILDLDGRFVARVDLLGEEVGVVAEYDGAFHAGAERRRSDAARQEVLEELGLVVIRANDPDIATHEGRVGWQARLRRAHDRARTSQRPQRWSVARRASQSGTE